MIDVRTKRDNGVKELYVVHVLMDFVTFELSHFMVLLKEVLEFLPFLTFVACFTPYGIK